MKVQEISYDHLFFVTECDDELVQPVRGVIFHDVPKDRFTADLYHRFRALIGFLSEPGSHSTRENRDLHSTPSAIFSRRLSSKRRTNHGTRNLRLKYGRRDVLTDLVKSIQKNVVNARKDQSKGPSGR